MLSYIYIYIRCPPPKSKIPNGVFLFDTSEQTTQTTHLCFESVFLVTSKSPSSAFGELGEFSLTGTIRKGWLSRHGTETLSWVAHQNRVHKDDLSGGKKKFWNNFAHKRFDLAVFSFRWFVPKSSAEMRRSWLILLFRQKKSLGALNFLKAFQIKLCWTKNRNTPDTTRGKRIQHSDMRS